MAGPSSEEATQPAGCSPARFLLLVKAETAPPALLMDGIRDLYAMLEPVAESNRNFLNTIAPVLQNSGDQAIKERAEGAVRTGLAFAQAQQDLQRQMAALNSHDHVQVTGAAKAAQAWGYLALKLRDETDALRSWFSAPSPAGV